MEVGLTETSVISVNDLRNKGFKSRNSWKSIDSVEVKIAADGEIAGPNVMMGYFNDEQLTNEVIVDGYFHGDIGEFDKDGFLKITDRKKMFKTSGGKYITTNHHKICDEKTSFY
jgi:long-chain acyl-CoA synthetase